MISLVITSNETPQGTIVGPFVVGPANKWNGRSPHGMSANGLILISNTTANPVKITSPVVEGGAFALTFQTLQEGKSYSLSFLSAPDLAVGNHQQIVKLATDSKETPVLEVELNLVVSPGLTVSPANLVFERVIVSDPEADISFVSKFVWLRLGRGAGLEVKNISSDLPFLKTKIESDQSAGQAVVLRVGFGEKPKKGIHTGKLRIETNNSDVPVIEVPVTVKAE